MKILRSSSLSQYLNRVLFTVGVLGLLLAFLFLNTLGVQKWDLAILMTVLTFVFTNLLYRLKIRILSPFERALLHLESIEVEDYNQYAKSDFESGHTAELHQKLKSLSSHFQSQKSRYDQHAFLLYQLIDQLNTPIMVLNKKLKLTYANAAFTILYGQPWQMYRMASASGLGLNKTEKGWQLSRKDQQWQISQSEFIDAGETHQLLVFTNIDSAIRASQQSAWQQIIRVMGHEIRNSLTPVSSLAESLSSSSTSDRDRHALEVISERCQHLNDFISRYASMSQQLTLDIQSIECERIVERIKPLFLDENITFDVKVESMDVDVVFFEQVLINLVKNSFEAGASNVEVSFSISSSHSIRNIEVVLKDDGQGIANTENLFVPLFTTKPQGQGIGLTFCRNIIEQHGGSIDIINNSDVHKHSSSNAQLDSQTRLHNPNETKGVSVIVKLPIR